MTEATSKDPLLQGGLLAVLAALAFGITTPLISRFGHGVGPLPSAALLYLGATLTTIDPRRSTGCEAPVRLAHLRRLVPIAIVGALIAPACLTWGIQRMNPTTASLLLNFEAIFTVFLAWVFFREPVGKRVALALVVMVGGGVCLVAGQISKLDALGVGALAVVVATFAWSLDNTLARPIADLDPTKVVRWKGAIGGTLALVAALALRQPFPSLGATVGLLVCGATGYGLSLRLYLLAQRRMGAARTGSVFALAPFIGVAVAWILGDRSGDRWTVVGGALFAAGVWLHLTEKHRHHHTHAAVEHEHAHTHDDHHHDHPHDPPVLGANSHTHSHHARTHDHPHAPDLHHQHEHGPS